MVHAKKPGLRSSTTLSSRRDSWLAAAGRRLRKLNNKQGKPHGLPLLCQCGLLLWLRSDDQIPNLGIRCGGNNLLRHQVCFRLVGPAVDDLLGRSEERRVGKECRSRWS